VQIPDISSQRLCSTGEGVSSHSIFVVFFHTSTASHPSFCQASSLSTHLVTANGLASSHSFYSHTAMSCDETIAQCGAWTTFPAQPYDCLLSGPSHSSNATDRSSDLFTAPSASSGDEETDVGRVADPTSQASTTALSGDNVSTHSTETQRSRADVGLSMDHGSMPGIDSMPLSMQGNVDASNHEGQMTITSPGHPLTAANLEAYEMTTSAVSSSYSSVALWLASGVDDSQSSIVSWSHLVASDSLAAEIEAATGIDTHE
jgi:hypothetical protein